MKKFLLLCMATTALGLSAQTQTATPTYKTFKFEDGGILTGMSDNGQWGAFCVQAEDGSTTQVYNVGARRVNLRTTESLSLTEGLKADTVKASSAQDVTNDGNIIVGSINNHAAYYNVTESAWHFVQQTGLRGEIKYVTPDGRYAVGLVNPNGDEYEEKPALWNLTTGDTIATPNLPLLDQAHENQKQNRFIGIAADGKYVLGCLSFSYLPTENGGGGCSYYVYNTENHTYKFIGFETSDTEAWKPLADKLLFISEATFSNNGRYVTGSAYYFNDNDNTNSSIAANEFYCPFKYDVEKDEFTLYNDTYSQSYAGFTVDNGGEVYAAGPEGNPYRDFGVRSGAYWVNFTQGIQQHYNLDILSKLGYDNSGTPIAISDDSRTLGVFTSNVDSYVITLPEPFSNIAATTDLLSAYTATPAAGSTFSKLTNVKLTFTRNVQPLVQANKIQVRDVLENKVVGSALSIQTDATEPNTINIQFRAVNLSNDAMPYELVIPAKAISIKGDATRYNQEIKISYTGRSNTPMQVLSTSPKADASLAKIDASTSPITFNFDAGVALTSTSARAQLYQKGISSPVANLLLGVNGRRLFAYSATQQNLLKDVDYQVVLPAGIVTDVTGNTATANEAYTLNLRGAYEREISYDSNVLYSENFDNGMSGVLLYDGDTNTPDDESQEYSFKAAGNEYAWVPIRDEAEGATGYSAASTSMYTPAGKSDDWLVTPQINVMDSRCTLTFRSQNLRRAASDSLKVIVWPSDNIYSTLNDDIVDRMKAEGTVVYFEREYPGADESILEGYWKNDTISLAQFAGKNVYIAFVNQNRNQSLLFLDDIKVLHDLPFFAAFDIDETVVNQSKAKIKGNIRINDNDTYTSLSLTLKDAAGNEIDHITASGLNLKKNDVYQFAFTKELPLTVGAINRFNVDFKLGEKENSVSKTISDLSFEPTKRVTLEEFTGMGCVNCPLGIIAIDHLSQTYGDLFIPMALHCYTGDQLASGVTNYAAFLNLTAAPSGRIQRGEITYPITQDTKTGKYSFTPGENTSNDVTWQSELESQLTKPAAAEVTATSRLSTNGKSITVPCTVKYALNASDVNIKLFAVVLENGLIGYQSNGFSSIADDVIGDWGQGGKYGTASVNPFTFNHVVRGYWGDTFTGTSELFPTTIEAGKEYTTTLSIPVPDAVENANNTDVVVMLFDGNTDRLINAYKTHPSNAVDGIDEIMDNTTAAVSVAAANGAIVVTSPLAAQATVYSLDGRALARTQGEGTLTLRPATQGVVIVKVTTAQGVVVKKVMM